MRDILCMHMAKTSEELPGEVLDMVHRHGLLRFFSLAKLIFKATLTVLHHNVLDESLLLIK